MGITANASLTDTTRTVIEEAKFTSQFKAVMAGMCWKIRKELHDGTTVNVPYYGVVSAHSLTEGQDMANPQAMADTNVQVTPAEVNYN